MCIARVNIYLPDDLAEEVRAQAVNVSQVAQEALRKQLGRKKTAEWVARVRTLSPTNVTHEEVISALHAVREEMGVPGA